jgi:hypothetical protein
MDNNRKSLIHKIFSKDVVFTPLEAVHLKYLSRKGLLKELADVEAKSNPYIAAQGASSKMSSFYIGFLVNRVRQEDPELFHSYNYAYEQLLNLDDGIGRLGYKGLALLTQLTSMRHEYFVRLILSDDSEKMMQQLKNDFKNVASPLIMRFSTYSFVHQKEVTYEETLASLGNTFQYLIRSIDNILTLNYYLDKLIDLEDLECLLFLKKWLNNGSKLDNEGYPKPFFNAARLCCSEANILRILNDDHQDYVDEFSDGIKNIPMSFGESSLQYVKETIITTISDSTPS